MGDRSAKNALFDGFATVAKALASGRRAEIVELLAQGERSVEEIAGAIEQSVANTSHHLRTLSNAGLVRRRRQGTSVRYRLASPKVEALWEALREVAVDHLDELDRLARDYMGAPDELEPVSRRELFERLERGEVDVLDVRPLLEFDAGHIPDAHPVPIDDLPKRLEILTRSREVVAYCRGPYCVYADEAVRLLRSQGFEARRLEDGFPEWRREGFPVESGAARGER